MSQKWSHQLASQFELRLPDDVVEWFDAEVWREESPISFGTPDGPKSIASSIWRGQMLPDTVLAQREHCAFVTADQRLVNNLQPHFPFIISLSSLP